MNISLLTKDQYVAQAQANYSSACQTDAGFQSTGNCTAAKLQKNASFIQSGLDSLPACSVATNIQSFGGNIDPTSGAMIISLGIGWYVVGESGLLMGIVAAIGTFFLLPSNCGHCITSASKVSQVDCGL